MICNLVCSGGNMAELLRNFWQLGWILYGASLGPVRYFGHSCEILYAEGKRFEIEDLKLK